MKVKRAICEKCGKNLTDVYMSSIFFILYSLGVYFCGVIIGQLTG